MDKRKISAMCFASTAFLALQPVVATTAMSATETTASSEFLTPLEPFTLEEIIDVDKLGFDCIREDLIDIAFHATGKGIAMPRTCLPEPCVKALQPEELALLIGRQANDAEWGQYFARYADVCRKEVIVPASFDAGLVPGPDLGQGGGLAQGGGVPAAGLGTPTIDFWTPLLAALIGTPGLTTAASNTPGSGIPSVGGGSSSSGGDTSTPTLIQPTVPDATFTDTSSEGVAPGGGTITPTPAPIPLPAAFWMLLGALTCLTVPWKKRRRTSASQSA